MERYASILSWQIIGNQFCQAVLWRQQVGTYSNEQNEAQIKESTSSFSGNVEDGADDEVRTAVQLQTL
jgi:hypothetical protein